MDERKLQEVLSDEAFAKELAELDTPEEVQARLKEKGADVSVEEIEQVVKLLQAQTEGELSEDDLEDVAGGVVGALVAAIAVATLNAYIVYSIRRRRW